MSKRKQHIKVTKFHTFYKEMKKLVQDPKSVILTDKEIWVLVNGALPYEARVSISTFEKWKGTGRRSVENNEQITEQEASEFRQCLDYARAKQKMALTGNMLDEDNKNQWGASWVLERKFEDLKKQPMIALNSNPQINISAGDAEAAKLIDGLINGDVIDIDHEEDNKRIEE